MCPSAPRVCSEPGGQKPVLSLSLDLIYWGVFHSWDEVDKPIKTEISSDKQPQWHYLWLFFAWRDHGNMSPYPGRRVNASYKRIVLCGGTQFRTRVPEYQDNSAIRYYTECPNHSAMSKTDWYYSLMVLHTRHNSKTTLGRDESSRVFLHLALAYWHYFCLGETWERLRALVAG